MKLKGLFLGFAAPAVMACGGPAPAPVVIVEAPKPPLVLPPHQGCEMSRTEYPAQPSSVTGHPPIKTCVVEIGCVALEGFGDMQFELYCTDTACTCTLDGDNLGNAFVVNGCGLDLKQYAIVIGGACGISLPQDIRGR